MKRTTSISWCAGLAAALLLVASAAADLVILYDSGRSWPIDRYLEPLLPTGQEPNKHQSDPKRPVPGSPILKTLLPIRSPSLTPGPVAARKFEAPIPVAFFIIGSDDESLRWLRKHRDVLMSQGAVGLLVDASTKEDLEDVEDVAGGLPITPASGEDIAKALRVEHYPFAVSEGRIWQ